MNVFDEKIFYFSFYKNLLFYLYIQILTKQGKKLCTEINNNRVMWGIKNKIIKRLMKGGKKKNAMTTALEEKY